MLQEKRSMTASGPWTMYLTSTTPSPTTTTPAYMCPERLILLLLHLLGRDARLLLVLDPAAGHLWPGTPAYQHHPPPARCLYPREFAQLAARHNRAGLLPHHRVGVRVRDADGRRLHGNCSATSGGNSYLFFLIVAMLNEPH